MGCSASKGTAVSFEGDDLDEAYSRAKAQLLKSGGKVTVAALAASLLEESKLVNSNLEKVHKFHPDELGSDVLGSLGKAVSPLGISISNYAEKMGSASEEAVAKAKAIAEGLREKKRVLMVIDVQDGYDSEFIASLPTSCIL